jgi:hypothetical protein
LDGVRHCCEHWESVWRLLFMVDSCGDDLSIRIGYVPIDLRAAAIEQIAN